MKTRLSILFVLLALLALSSCCDKTPIESRLADKFTAYNKPSESFESLANLVKDKQIIILGECGHGDGKTFEIKSEIVKYLDSVGDYTLILEGMNPFDGAILNEELPVLIINTSWLNVGSSWNPLWSHTEEASKLVDAMNKHQIDFYGMDVNPSYCNNFEIAYLSNLFYSDSIMKQWLFDYNWEKLLEIDNKLHQYNDSLINESDYPYYDSSLLAMRNKLSDNDVSFNKDAVLLLIDNMLSFSHQAKCGFSITCDSCIDRGIMIRDRQMADNVAWYINHHPEKKIIIWAANFHGAKAISQIKYGKEPDPELYEKYTLLGEHLANMFPNQVYSVAFTSGGGDVGWFNQDESDPIQPDSTSVEFALLQRGINYGYLDFGSHPEFEDIPFHSILLGYHNKIGKWVKSFDAIFYIKEQHRATQVIEQ
ncbi:MAG: erythromycin esterase family protein [Bacteroidales bacterium]|nr:erythromycin esterase family protein [Bacteroidales bacterium]